MIKWNIMNTQSIIARTLSDWNDESPKGSEASNKDLLCIEASFIDGIIVV